MQERRWQGRMVKAPGIEHLRFTPEPPPSQLSGVSNLEAGLVLLTHPMRGYFFRRDGALGSYRIWHDRTEPTVGEIQVN